MSGDTISLEYYETFCERQEHPMSTRAQDTIIFVKTANMPCRAHRRIRSHRRGRMNLKHTARVMVFDSHGPVGMVWLCLGIVGMGAGIHIVLLCDEGPGASTSRSCGEAYMQRWVSWPGWLKSSVAGCGLHTRSYVPEGLGHIASAHIT